MEIWKNIPKFKNEYQISDMGRIRSVLKVIVKSDNSKYTRRSKVLKPDIKHDGYARGAVSLVGKMIPYKIHRLVAIAFIPNPENKKTVNHINGIKTDNRAVNLEWNTQQENVTHSHKHGLAYILKGSEIGNSILKENQVVEIRAKFVPRIYTRKKLANEYGVTEATIKDILGGRTWKHLL